MNRRFVSFRLFSLFSFALLAASCANQPYEGPVAVVDGSQRSQYWVDKNPLGSEMPDPCEPGIVTAEYTIGSDGNVYDVKVLGSRPTIPRNESAVKNDLWYRRFEASPNNPQHYAIRVTHDFQIDCGPGKPKWR